MRILVKQLRDFANLIENVDELNRPLTLEEYRYIKELPLFTDVENFWNCHLSEAGFREYRASVSQGRHGKWKVYLNIYKRTNNKLYKALK